MPALCCPKHAPLRGVQTRLRLDTQAHGVRIGEAVPERGRRRIRCLRAQPCGLPFRLDSDGMGQPA